MATSNFHNVNARNVYAVLMNTEEPVLDDNDEETGETECSPPESWECEEFIEMLKEDGRAWAIEKNVSFYKSCSDDPHELRSYGSTKLFQLYDKNTFGDISVEVNINCVMRGAYYEGASLDWYMTYNVCDNNSDEIDFEEEALYQSSMPVGMIKIQARNAEKWAEKAKEKLIDIVEEFFTNKSMPLTVTARFSNGETIYKKVI